MSVVYIIEMVGHDLVKIGKTSNVSARLSTLQTGSPFDLKLFAVFCGKVECSNGDLEAQLHRRFDHLRVRGEWFRFAPEIRALKDLLDPPHGDEIRTADLRSAFAESPESFCSDCGMPIGCEPQWRGIGDLHFSCPVLA